jgi:hypothetical protein
VWPQVTDVLVREDLKVEKLSVSHNKICREMLKGMISFGEIQNRRQQGDYSDDLKEVFPLPSDTKVAQVPTVAENVTPETVQKVFDAYWNENESEWKPRTRTQYKTCHNHLLDFLSHDQMLHTIKYEAGRNYKNLLSNTITNRGEKMSTARVDLYLGYASQLFN